MKKMKKLTAFFLSVVIIAASAVIASYAADADTRILNIYSDGMLFLQNSEAVISGTGTPGEKITLTLTDNQDVIAESETEVLSDGSFNVSFNTPAGSFTEYTIVLKENGKVFDTLENVVFGELWLASGQSNMQYPLAQSKTGQDMYKNSRKLSPWLRVLLVPSYPEYNNSTELVPALEQNDITDALWVNGENTAVYNMSAVAYFFAEKLMDTLGMPVGILNSSLGGSSIRSWLSREAIESNPEFKAYLSERGEYFSLSEWNESAQSIYYDMTANFNQKIAPLKNFRISGMLWYQGETDLITGNTRYDDALDLLQQSYTDLFNYSDGLLPLIFTQIASYNYSETSDMLDNWNFDFTKMQQKESSSRALITIYDIPLTYLPEAGLIHPERKEEVGQRMAAAANGLLYNKNDGYTTATIKSTEIKDNSIYIKLDNTGSGLIIDGKSAKGFSICGSDGIYVSATAEVVSPDTVRVYSAEVSHPESVTYAFGVANQSANLYASINGELSLPVAPFITNPEYSQNIWIQKSWCDCDEELTWHTEDDEFSGYYSTWNGNNAEISYSENDSQNNTVGLGVSSQKCSFSISPVISYKDNLTQKIFKDSDNNLSKYGTISFYVRNNGNEAVIFEGLRFYQNPILWYSPEVSGTLDTAAEIPADGQWHQITLNLNKLYHLGNECSLSYTNEKLKDISEIRFVFSANGNSISKLSIDNITFAPTGKITSIPYEVDIKNADNIFELFTAVFLTIVGKIALLFS